MSPQCSTQYAHTETETLGLTWRQPGGLRLHVHASPAQPTNKPGFAYHSQRVVCNSCKAHTSALQHRPRGSAQNTARLHTTRYKRPVQVFPLAPSIRASSATDTCLRHVDVMDGCGSAGADLCYMYSRLFAPNLQRSSIVGGRTG